MSERVAADLPDYFPSELELRLQDRTTFDQLHDMGEAGHYLFSMAHKAIHVAAKPSLDNELLTNAVMTGVAAYEIITYATNGGTRYDEVEEMAVVIGGANNFLADIKNPDDFMAKADYAHLRLAQDTPMLAEVIEEVTARHVNHDKVATQFALKGAAVLRSMQIYVDRKLAS